MDNYVTGAVIRRYREQKRLTQEKLATRIGVSGKAVSKWETGQGFPDISLLEPLARELGLSVIELLSGQDVCNRNRSFDMRKVKFYVCPVCGNVLQATGEATVSCCGVTLPPAAAEPADAAHGVRVEIAEDEYYITMDHPMEKDHFISFFAAVSDQGVRFVKLYPEGCAQMRCKIDRVQKIYVYCNRHGLFEYDPRKK